ncbi:hypothetical protein J7443_00950 [Tropicibacter sp. R15_0]|uniref:hypothetical protein n=1 Tax=Tropicibacter sp. R15_0 TaxID=2821101 RepID=UPI001ADB41DF|nr:hypothetical protein [Tropicibacter sp. R15_0]MBO9463783.1 hypothetical protein [Tropicibacter sp. R15_0]
MPHSELIELDELPFDTHREAEIEVHVGFPADYVHPDDPHPGDAIMLNEFRSRSEELINPDEVVLKADKTRLLIERPEGIHAFCEITAKDELGFTRAELMDLLISACAAFMPIFRKSYEYAEPENSLAEQEGWLPPPWETTTIQFFDIHEIDGVHWILPYLDG